MACVALDDRYKEGVSDLSEIPEGERFAGMRLRFIRETSNHSLRSLAEAIGTASSTLQQWETEPGNLKRRKHAVYITKAAEVLHTSEIKIWYGDKPAPGMPESLVEELAVFLTRAWSRSDVPEDIRSRSKVLLSELMGFDRETDTSEPETDD